MPARISRPWAIGVGAGLVLLALMAAMLVLRHRNKLPKPPPQIELSAAAATLPIEATRPKLGLNLNAPAYWKGYRPYLNLIRGSGHAWEGSGVSRVDPHGWIAQLAPGETLNKYVLIHADLRSSWVEPGRYVITWSGPLNVRVAESGIPRDVAKQRNRIEFTLPAITPENSQGIFIALAVDNPTGERASLTDVKVFLKSREALVQRGELFEPTFLEPLKAASVLRLMDLGATNNSKVRDPKDLPTELNLDWSVMPPAVMGKLGTAVARDLWITVPHMASAATMDALFEGIQAQYPRGRVWVEYSNELWNTMFQQGPWVADNKVGAAPVLDVNGRPSRQYSDRVAAGAARGSMEAWASAERIFGRQRIVRVFSGQAVNFNALGGAFHFAHAELFDGKPLKDLVDVYAIAPYYYFKWGNGPDGRPLPTGLRARLLREEHKQDDAFFDALSTQGIQEAAQATARSWRALRQVAPKAKLVSYEAGHHVYVEMDNYADLAGDAWQAQVDTTNNTLVFTESLGNAFADGDTAYIYYQDNEPLFHFKEPYAHPNVGWEPFWVRKVGDNRLRCYQSLADYRADRPTTLVARKNGGPFHLGNYGRTIALAERIQSYHDSAAGAQQYANYYESLGQNGLTLFNHFADSGGYSSVRAGSKKSFQFSLKRSHYEPDSAYPRSSWFQALARDNPSLAAP